MPRNKHPEETVDSILDTSLKLFMEKGYDNTTIQDILNNLGGLTKGAIYHHFKSKEDIMLAITDKLYGDQEALLSSVCARKDLNGLEKLRELMRASLHNPGQEKMFSTAPDLTKSPHMLIAMLNDTFSTALPRFVLPIIEEGVADGSIKTEYPKQLAEVILLLANIWANPMVLKASDEEMAQRLAYMATMSDALGLPGLIDRDIVQRLEHYQDLYNEK